MKKKIEYIGYIPTWVAILPLLLHVLNEGTAEGQRIAREELSRMASIADTAVAAAQKAA
jgi:hypothetical protein